ncbi:MAG TPA: hypothetical protein VGK84_05960, partial [Candidatus Tumulicola sp.]
MRIFAQGSRILSGIALIALGACNATNGVAANPAANPAGEMSTTTGDAAHGYTTNYVQVVIFENESYDEVIGSSQAPYITSLSKAWANMTQSFAITHPSQPNYLALFSGSTQGVTSDQCPVSFGVD